MALRRATGIFPVRSLAIISWRAIEAETQAPRRIKRVVSSKSKIKSQLWGEDSQSLRLQTINLSWGKANPSQLTVISVRTKVRPSALSLVFHTRELIEIRIRSLEEWEPTRPLAGDHQTIKVQKSKSNRRSRRLRRTPCACPAGTKHEWCLTESAWPTTSSTLSVTCHLTTKSSSLQRITWILCSQVPVSNTSCNQKSTPNWALRILKERLTNLTPLSRKKFPIPSSASQRRSLEPTTRRIPVFVLVEASDLPWTSRKKRSEKSLVKDRRTSRKIPK